MARDSSIHIHISIITISCIFYAILCLINIDGVQPHIETIDETAKGNKLPRERSNLSREGTTLSRQGTLTSLKKQGSNLSGKKVAQKEGNKGTESGEKPLLVIFVPLLGLKKNSRAKDFRTALN